MSVLKFGQNKAATVECIALWDVQVSKLTWKPVSILSHFKTSSQWKSDAVSWRCSAPPSGYVMLVLVRLLRLSSLTSQACWTYRSSAGLCDFDGTLATCSAPLATHSWGPLCNNSFTSATLTAAPCSPSLWNIIWMRWTLFFKFILFTNFPSDHFSVSVWFGKQVFILWAQNNISRNEYYLGTITM